MRFSFRRPITSYSKVRRLISMVHHTGWFHREVGPGSYLNLGCGPSIEAGFVNVDMEWRPGLDLCLDLTGRLPVRDSSIAGIVTEHCLEHLTLADGRRMLGECFRTMTPGAVLRVVVPDLELYARAYIAGLDGQPAVLPNEYFVNRTGVNAAVAVFNELFYGPDHRFNYDFRTLAEVLKGVGFAEVTKCAFRQGRDPRLLIDHPGHLSESLYVEALKT